MSPPPPPPQQPQQSQRRSMPAAAAAAFSAAAFSAPLPPSALASKSASVSPPSPPSTSPQKHSLRAEPRAAPSSSPPPPPSPSPSPKPSPVTRRTRRVTPPAAASSSSPLSPSAMPSPPHSSPKPLQQQRQLRHEEGEEDDGSDRRVRASSPLAKSRYVSSLREALSDHAPEQAHAQFWAAMQSEARAAATDEPLLASFLFSSVLNHATLSSALAFHLANKLSSPAMPSTMLMRLFHSTMDDDPRFYVAVRRDLLAVMDRDPACVRFIDALLYFKGFHALQAHRVAHALWLQNRQPLAYHLQSQVSKELQVDIHPAASIGAGVFIDHATGIVVGETAVIGDDCSLLHHVTLGGSGKMHGVRHPKLGNGVLVGAGATLLGNVVVGDAAQIGACSLVLEDIPAGATVVGVPAKLINTRSKAVPALEMAHERCIPGCTDESHGHVVPLQDGAALADAPSSVASSSSSSLPSPSSSPASSPSTSRAKPPPLSDSADSPAPFKELPVDPSS